MNFSDTDKFSNGDSGVNKDNVVVNKSNFFFFCLTSKFFTGSLQKDRFYISKGS